MAVGLEAARYVTHIYVYVYAYVYVYTHTHIYTYITMYMYILYVYVRIHTCVIQYDSAEWKPAFLRQAREFLFFPLLSREASK